ncbi:MAG: hypothetical protein RL556_776, partial [Actinomycetota bacterium]
AKVAAAFDGKVVVIEAGDLKARSNDTDYRFRAHSAFAHLTGWGADTVPGSVLVIDARAAVKTTLYLRPTAGRNTDEFFANPQIGEFWVGQRPTLEQVSTRLGLPTRDLAYLPTDLGSVVKTKQLTLAKSPELAEFVSEMRLVKDAYEIAQMREAVAASVKGFESIVRSLPKAVKHERGERIVEGAFFAEARANGNDLGYDTIAASGPNACTLHWISNHGKVRSGDLILVDAGVEVESLYTADVTRTLPVNGKFTATQKMIYEAVLEAADAAFAIAKPGVKFSELHAAAMNVIAAKTAAWGLLPVSAEESLEPDKQFHRRYMVHGTSHHLGLDVHDCAQARREMYMDAELKPGMVFTIEPGLYFHADDLMVPKEFRGIGVRIEDDVLVTKNGVENLTAALPRKVRDVEKWMRKQR